MDANLTPQYATSLKNAQLHNDAALVVARKTLDAQKQQGEAAVELIQQVEQLSAQLAQGQIDIEL